MFKNIFFKKNPKTCRARSVFPVVCRKGLNTPESKQQRGGVGEGWGDAAETGSVECLTFPPVCTDARSYLAETGMGSLEFMSRNRKKMIVVAFGKLP